MNMEGFLEHLEQQDAREKVLDRRDAEERHWFDQGQPPEVRLLRFDGWVRGQLAARIDCKRGSGYRWAEARVASDAVKDYAERSLTVVA